MHFPILTMLIALRLSREVQTEVGSQRPAHSETGAPAPSEVSP